MGCSRVPFSLGIRTDGAQVLVFYFIDMLALVECFSFLLVVCHDLPLAWTLVPPPFDLVSLDEVPDILHIFADEVRQEKAKFVKFSVHWVLEPRKNLDSVTGLSFKVVSDVVDDDGLAEISAQGAKVFDVNSIVILAVLTVEPI